MAKSQLPEKHVKDKKDSKKKEKRSDKDGVHKVKKDKKRKAVVDVENGDLPAAVLNQLEAQAEIRDASPKRENGDVAMTDAPILGALVPFANPLADEKVTKKILKSVKKAAKNQSIKRGVKEVVKALRKSPMGNRTDAPPGVVILAADISPMDVISHFPVLCEDHNVPYIFVRSRAELGVAGSTKRPTSVVMIGPERERGGKKKTEQTAEEVAEYEEVYKSLLKLVEKESRNVRI
ncbi:MAG: hypothetical protein M1823_006114 [Watsoniomyces obsoletus]|nr:MAG: hypothetical protein M1823_006114 [Watsoniomyces obsoletus]